MRTPSKKAVKRLVKAFAEDAENNPFKRSKKGKLFMRYDQLLLANRGGIWDLEFYWQGKAIYTVPVGNLQDAASFSLGVRGKIEVTLSGG